MKYKVEKVVLCEVSVWALVEAASMGEALGMAASAGTGENQYDHEIVSDVKTIAVNIKEVA